MWAWIIGVLIYLNPLGLCRPDKWRQSAKSRWGFYWWRSSHCLPFRCSRGTLNAVRFLRNPREQPKMFHPVLQEFMRCSQWVLWHLDTRSTKANVVWIILAITVTQMHVQWTFSLLNGFRLVQTWQLNGTGCSFAQLKPVGAQPRGLCKRPLQHQPKYPPFSRTEAWCARVKQGKVNR